jgi:hypothetical protein
MSKNCTCAQVIERYAMKAYGKVDILICDFWISALAGGVVSFIPWERAPVAVG